MYETSNGFKLQPFCSSEKVTFYKSIATHEKTRVIHNPGFFTY